jgi:hypothetical protein
MSFLEASEMSGIKSGFNTNNMDDLQTLKLLKTVLPYNPIELSD